MSKFIKIAVIIAVAAVAIAAKQRASPTSDKTAVSIAPTLFVSPAEITHRVGQLPELEIDSLF